MSILKIMLIDMRRCRMQLLLMLFFLLIAIFMASSGTGIAYLTFAAIILATQPFYTNSAQKQALSVCCPQLCRNGLPEDIFLECS